MKKHIDFSKRVGYLDFNETGRKPHNRQENTMYTADYYNGPMLMNPATGSVATRAEWLADFNTMTPEEWAGKISMTPVWLKSCRTGTAAGRKQTN